MKRDQGFWQETIRAALAHRTESNILDFKKDLSEDQERLKEHINAFGNGQGGLFAFGVDRSFQFTSEPLDLEQVGKRLADVARDTQVPPLRVEILHLEVQGRRLLGVHVLPGDQRPVFIKDRSPLGGEACFRRSGANTVPMTIGEIRELLRESADVTLDETRLEGAGIDGLDQRELASTFPGYRPDDGESIGNITRLLDEKVLVGSPSDYSVSLAGWLTFAKAPQALRKLRNASIELQQFRGRTRDEPLRTLNIAGTLAQQFDAAMAMLKQNIWVIPKIEGAKREEIPAYDEKALREVVINCMVHRDYTQMHQPVKIAMFSDRIEFENPGGLLPGLTTLNLIHKRKWRNPTLAGLMEKLKLGEMDGQGIDRLYAGTRRLKVPAPIFMDDGLTFKVILSGPKAYDDFTPDEKRLTVLILFIMDQKVDNESVRNAFGIDTTKASTLLKSLVAEGMIELTSASKKYASYRLTAEYRERILG